MDSGAEKVYVCVGSDPQDGHATLEWALRNWSSHSISFVILHAPATSSSKDYVYTPFGKLPASYVNEEKLELLRKMKERENDKLLSQYKAFCGKVKAEILTIDKYDKPLHKHLVELISELRITKLVMGITFSKSSSTGKSRAAIGGSFYVHRHKPEFCELFIVCGGKLVFLREENNEGFIEDDGGATVARFKEKGIFRGWLGKKLPETSSNEKSLTSSPSTSKASPDQWEGHVQEIESYFHRLMSSNSDEERSLVDRNGTLWNSQDEPYMAEDMGASEKIEALKVKIREANEAIELNRREAKANVERHARAEWAICLCTRRAEELEACINKEIATRVDAKKELDAVKEEVCEIVSEVEDKKSKLKSMLELQHELSNKLQLSSLSKSRAESQLHQAVSSRAEMVREIEELRRQRDVLQRRIEFCKEKDAIGLATRMSDLSFSYREFTADEIRAATDNFSERLRLKSAGDWTNVYRGRINHTTVAIKLCVNSHNGPSQEAFHLKVRVLSQIRHPYLLAMIGFCSDLKCIVFEFMHNGCLRDLLFSAPRSHRRRTRNRSLNWHARIRIAAQVSSGLAFLHSARPRPISHGNLNPAQILVDRNLAAKIHGFRAAWCRHQFELRSDIRAFGNLVLQLLTGRNWAGLAEESIVTDRSGLIEVLDELAGEWPLDMAVELVRIAMRCLCANKVVEKEVAMEMVAREIEEMRKKADDLAAVEEEREGSIDGGEAINMDDWVDVPRAFLCPIYQEAMKNPHLAADGYSYELEAMEEWLRSGQDRSPMTNLKLNHKLLTPNHTLRSLIHDWRCKTSFTDPPA